MIKAERIGNKLLRCPKCAFVVLLVAVLSVFTLLWLSACNNPPTSQPIPVDGTVFVGRQTDDNAVAVIIYDNAAYVGNYKNKGTNGYATFQDRFTRLVLEFDGAIYRVVNLSSLWQSAVMHDYYPKGFIFNDDGSMLWISAISFSDYDGAGVTLEGVKWPTSKFETIDNVVAIEKIADAPENLKINDAKLSFTSTEETVFIEQTGTSIKYGFGTNPIDLEDWDFSDFGEVTFNLRSLGGYPDYGEDGYLNKFTVSSDLSTSASINIVRGEDLAKPSNVRIEERISADGACLLDLHWDDVPAATRYTTSKGFGNTSPWAHFGVLPRYGSSGSTLSVGANTITIFAHKNKEIKNGEIIFYTSSETTVVLTVKKDGTYSYVIEK